MSYTLLDCFPYAIDAVPLSAGASQATKVTANFYYSNTPLPTTTFKIILVNYYGITITGDTNL